MNKFSVLTASVLSALMLSSVSAAPVTTEGTGVGKHGDLAVAVTFDNGKITKIDVVQNKENKVLAQKVFTELKDNVVRTNSAEIDGIAGATFSLEIIHS